MAHRVVNFVIPTTPSRSLKEASKRAVKLYRDCLIATPVAVLQHELKFTVPETKERIRKLFDEHRGIQDPKIIDMKVFRGYQDLEEAVQLWSQRLQIERILAPEDGGHYLDHKKKTFLDKFYEGSL
eukprot:c4196_g1_i1.p1 GENE.c4196_g1_i1~~c4196_g1_i1.p1  ORF type:complete len:126 (+),score=39.02 c4196_g1_i1:54-431(+)